MHSKGVSFFVYMYKNEKSYKSKWIDCSGVQANPVTWRLSHQIVISDTCTLCTPGQKAELSQS